jgi:hypothetical protein
VSEVLNTGGQYSAFADTAILNALRTPWVDLCGALAEVSAIDLGIKVGREVLARTQVDPLAVDSMLAGSTAQASFDAFCRQFPTGGGRKRAAGINRLADEQLKEVAARLLDCYR